MSRKARQFWQPNGKIHPFVNAYCIHAYHAYAYILSHGLPAKLYSAFTIKWLEKTSGPGPSEQEIRMVALERKFDELLSFVQLIAKRNTDDENQRKEDDKDTSEGEPEGTFQHQRHSTKAADATKARGERLPFKAPEFEKYNGRGDPMIHLQMYCRKMAPYADNEPLLIQTFQDTLTGNAAEWYSQLKKISHWKELADTFLAQYGFNSQIAPDRISILQRMEKKSNETFREYAQRWREKAARARPPLDEREMIKIFVDTLKNPYFDRMIGLQMQFFVDLIPVGERIEGCLEDKEDKAMGRPRQVLPTFTMQSVQPRPTPTPAPTQVPAPAPAPQMPARPVGNQPNDNRWPRKEPRQFTPLPMPMTELYPILIEKNLISPTIPRPYNGAPRKDFNQNLTCDFHFGEFEGLPNITTNPLPNHPEGGVNMVEIEEGNEERILWRRLFYTLEKQRDTSPLGREEIPSERSHQPDDPSDFDWYAELNLDDIVEDEMDLDNLQDEGADWGYFMEDDTDEWRDVISPNYSNSHALIVPPGFETPEFEIFYENGDPEVHLQKYGEKMALHLENELLMISVFPESLSKQAAAWFYQLRNLTGWDDLARVFLERYRFNPHSILEYLGLSIHTIAEEEDSTTTPPTRHCQQGEEAKMWTCVPLLQRVSSSNEVKKPREVKIGTRCTTEQKEALIALLREFHEIFAWSYQDMPGLDTDIVVHKIPLKPECKPVKQALRRMKPEVILKIKEEVEKQLKAGFLSTVTYSDWVANIVPVPKKDGKVRMCVDYRDLNRASPKDNFPLPHIDTLVDNTATNAVFSFMDGFSGYNQIKMAEEDKSKTAFVTHWGTFVYDVMPFGLKNAGATYQRAMVTLFHDMIHHEIEVYVDDMIAKSRTAQDHLTDLRKLFQRLKKYQLRLNPNKCAFGVTSGKLLGFIVSGRGIEIDPAKLTATCEPLFKLLRKDVKIKWTEDCQKAFDKIKEYLLNPPILVPPTPGRPLILYLTDLRFTSRFWGSLQKALAIKQVLGWHLMRLYMGEGVGLQSIGMRLRVAQSRQKSYADTRRRDLEFEIGDMVFVRVAPMKGVMRFGRKGKLSPRYVGPFEILERVGLVAYKLALPPALSGIHNVFHISMLRRYVSDPTHILSYEPLQVQDDLSYEEMPMKILDRKDQVLRNKTIRLVKVLWRNHSTGEASWERVDEMQSKYPHLFQNGDNLQECYTLKNGDASNIEGHRQCIMILE
uniref:Reverse transcriptase domain-containing protein n=1 Tax=Fagus sylvatica TaxID=28930 RepID=A0A2N9EG40_FAGSY